MKTILVFNSLDQNELEARSVQISVTECPVIMLKDTKFQLKIFKNPDEATVLKIYRDSEENLVISCEVSSRVIVELVKQGYLMENSIHFYELEERTWESII